MLTAVHPTMTTTVLMQAPSTDDGVDGRGRPEPLRLDANVAPGHGIAWIGLDADEPGGPSALAVGIGEGGGAGAFAGLHVCEKHRVGARLDLDLILEPRTRGECRAGRVVLCRRLVLVQVPDAIASLDLVDRAGAVLEF